MEIIVLTTSNNPFDSAEVVELDFQSADHVQVAQICKLLKRTDKREYHLVAFQGIAKHLPAIQVFLRANHARVLSYICIDELPSGQLNEWPDAPVIYLDTEGKQENLNLARLRNWQVVGSQKSELQSAITSSVALFE